MIDRTVASIESDMGTRRGSSSNSNSNSSNTPVSQFASHPQHNLTVAVKQEGFGSAANRRPSLRSNTTTPNSMVNVTEQLPIHRAPGMTNASYYNTPMSATSTGYPQMGYDLAQSALSTPTSASSSMQSSYIPAVTEESAHHQYLYTTSAAGSAAASQMNHTPPGTSPQTSHNPMVGYSNPQQTAAAQAHQHQQQQAAPTGWMNGVPPAANAMAVPNGTNPWHEWTSAIAMGVPPSSQDRYNANALLTLGSEQRGSGDPGGGGGGGGSGPGPHATVSVPGAQGGQWSMMMTYHNPNHTGG